jgi:cysteinyl-tRNA synthetase
MRGFEGNHIRFFLIYGHYRQKTNFSWKSFRESVGLLTSLQGMVQRITEETGAKRSDTRAGNLIRALKETFDERMSDDLDVKGAVDALHRNLSSLTILKKEGGLGRKETGKLQDIIKDIDGVLQVLGL